MKNWFFFQNIVTDALENKVFGHFEESAPCCRLEFDGLVY